MQIFSISFDMCACMGIFFSSSRLTVKLSRFMALRCQSNPAELTKDFPSSLSPFLASFLPFFFFFFFPTLLWFKDSLCLQVYLAQTDFRTFVYWNGPVLLGSFLFQYQPKTEGSGASEDFPNVIYIQSQHILSLGSL